MPPAQTFARLLKDTSCIIFDFDGVVVDSEPVSLGTLRDTLAAFGLQMTLDDVRKKFLGTSLNTIETHLDETRGCGASDGFAKAWQDALFRAFRADLQRMPGVTPLLDLLDEAHMPYCVASSSSFERLGVAQEAVGLAGRLSNLFSSEQVQNGKPAPDLFLLAAKRMDVDPARCLVIEDSPHGIRAATAAGMTSMGFVGGSHLRGIEAEHAALLFQAGATHVVDTYTDLLNGGALALSAIKSRTERLR